ncbi:hypothetical protein TWF694_006042 [Orbilia ellipsospora]|uniref:HNH nuclease domain-containing protein n=1 Tax=Orbilia ellipsospora TaxID=2528407 RepID=A0AAV9WR11_9PEZI
MDAYFDEDPTPRPRKQVDIPKLERPLPGPVFNRGVTAPEFATPIKPRSSKASVTVDKNDFSESIEWEVEKLSDYACWICSSEEGDTDVHHVIGKEDPGKRTSPTGAQFKDYLLKSRPDYVPPTCLNELEGSGVSGGLYQVHLREDIVGNQLQPVSVGKFGEPRIWHGSPAALIIHAARVLGCVDRTGWLPDDTLEILTEIIKAWRKE